MNNKEEAKEFLRKAEGFRSKVYLDSGGLPTIGYGQTKANADQFMPGMWKEWQRRGITKDEAELLLDKTLDHNIKEYSRNIPNFDKLKSNQKQAFYVLSYLYPYLFNPGLKDKGLKVQANKIKNLMITEQFDKVPDLVRFGENTRNADGSLKHPGLVKRWDSWAQLYHTGIAPDNIYGGNLNDPSIKDRSKQKYVSRLNGKIKEEQEKEDPNSKYNNTPLYQKMIDDSNAIYERYMKGIQERQMILDEQQRNYENFQKGMEMMTTPVEQNDTQQPTPIKEEPYLSGKFLDSSSNYGFTKLDIPIANIGSGKLSSYAEEPQTQFKLGGQIPTALSGLSGIAGAMSSNMSLKDTSEFENLYKNAPNQVGSFNSNYDLLKSWSHQTNLPSASFNDIDNTNIGNTLSSVGSGAMAGMSIGGGIGALIGGGVGLVGGLVSHFTGKNKANRRFRELNSMRQTADWAVNNKFNTQANNVEYDTDAMLARQFI